MSPLALAETNREGSLLEKVSVIFPAYNCAKSIGKCLDSLGRQGYDNVEVLVVDDGSSDDLARVMESYRQITLIRKENGGVASARNAGLDAATGDYIMFVDSDDYLDDGCIQSLMQEAQKQPADIIRFRFVWEYPDGTVLYDTNELPSRTYLSKEDFPQNVYRHMLAGIRFNSVWRQLFRRNVIEGVRFRTDVQTVEDAMFNVEAYTKAQSMLLVDGIYYHYYQSGMGLTGSALHVLDKYRCNIRFSKFLVQYLNAWGMDTPGNRIRAVFRLVIITVRKMRSIRKAKN